jgi:hypothetical protein
MKTKMLLPLLAIVFAVSGAFITKANKLVVEKWGYHSSMGCIQGTLLDESNCGTSVTNNGRCFVDFGDETANAFNIADCDTGPLYKQN